MRTWWWLVAVAALSGVAGQTELLEALDRLAERPDDVTVLPGVSLRRVARTRALNASGGEVSADEGERVLSRLEELASTRALDVRVDRLADAGAAFLPRFNFGKNTFLTGFGLGFLAFGLKKLLLPLFIGAQIVKSVLLALFLPSIIGGIAKLMGKGLTSVAHGSSSSSPGAAHAHDAITDFDFKDPGGGVGGYDSLGAGSGDEGASGGVWTYPPASEAGAARQPFPAYTSSGVGVNLKQPAADRYQKYTAATGWADHVNKHHGGFYAKDKQQDFKVFHNIPTSSHLLAHYDPFYSPLLSRLDSVFGQLGLGRLASGDEACRERLVCDMYAAPARYAPYSNLVSAQLSRELNELRKPSSDNPEILRFFRYMRAAKEGQSGAACAALYDGCTEGGAVPARPPMVTTFDDINKLVQARKLH